MNSQFTPRQVLEAGRRAESEGQRDYAIQFYQHIIAHHPSTAEAAEAADSLRRLDGHDHAGSRDPRIPAHVAPMPAPTPKPMSPPVHPPQGYHPQANGVAARHPSNGVPYQAAPLRPTFEIDPPTQPTQPHTQRNYRNGHDALAQRQPSRRTKEKARGGSAIAELEDHSDARTRTALKSYRLGRFLATLLGFIGLIGAIAGMVSLGANLVLWMTRMNNGLLAMLASSPLVAVALLVAACALILISQMAKATFDAVGHRTFAATDE